MIYHYKTWSHILVIAPIIWGGGEMRGWKMLRSKAPQLLDTDGDVCHHVHNTVKPFCKAFKWFAEKMDWSNSFRHKVYYWYYGFTERFVYIDCTICKTSSESKPLLVACHQLSFYWYHFDRPAYLVILCMDTISVFGNAWGRS